MKLNLKTTLAVLATAAFWTLAPQVHAQESVASLRGADVSKPDPAPEQIKYRGGRPGTQEKVAPTFIGQPPVIPHAVVNFDEITLEENQCLSCHGQATYKEKNAPKVGDSHFFDRDGNKLTDTSARRYNCQQCHVPQVDAPPLVESNFKGVVAGTQPPGGKPAAKKN